METREYYIDKDGFKFHAKITRPETINGKMPLLLLIHGLTGHMEEDHIIGIAQTAAECGMAVLRVEMYGHGKSDGNFANHNVLIWVNDVLYLIDYAKSLDYVSDLYIAGHSQGGLTMLLAAGLAPEKVKGAMLLSPAIVIADGCQTGEFLGHEFDIKNIPTKISFQPELAVTDNYVRMNSFLPVDMCIKNFEGPTLILHGTEDEAVPLSYATEAAPKYKNADLVIIEGDDHCYTRHFDEVKSKIKEWIMAHI